nr:putative metalloprotease CJM1_0395 family protein [Marinobacter sp. LA51]
MSPNLPVFSPSVTGQVSPRPEAEPSRTDSSSGKGQPKARASGDSATPEQGLSPEELKQLTELKARDREVRAHEAAHQAVGGQYAGAISYTFQRGPDGAQYAVGGEVPIDVSSVPGDPQATIEKMRVVRAAAMAPAEPSGQDRAVAAEAMQVMLKAQSEVMSGQEETENAKLKPGQGGEDDPQSRTAQQATGAYQTVSAMTDVAEQQRPGFRPVAA